MQKYVKIKKNVERNTKLNNLAVQTNQLTNYNLPFRERVFQIEKS